MNGVFTTGKDTRHALGANATSKTAGGFCLGAFFVISNLYFGKTGYPFIHCQLKQRDPRLVFNFSSLESFLEIFFREFHNWKIGSLGRFKILPLKISGDRAGDFMSAGNRLDHKCGSRNAVSCCKYTFFGGS